MGQGGGITFINGTAHDWKRSTPAQSHRMENWKIPEIIPAGHSITLYIEWPVGALTTGSSGFAHEVFTLENTPFSFELHARRIQDALTLQVYLSNLTTDNNPPGSTIDLGFAHNGDVRFILSGADGNFTSSNPSIAWMQRNIGTLGERRLRDICMPGTHNSGMSVPQDSTFWASKANCLCQELNIYEQLIAGARYFDIRPILSGAAIFTGHYSKIVSPVLGDILYTWQGMCGQPIADIVQQINRFTEEHKELVILNVSHSCSMGRDYEPFSDPEWVECHRQLSNLTHLCTVPDASSVALDDLPLSTFIGSSAPNAAVIVLTEANPCTLEPFREAGFYKATQLNIYDFYTCTMNAEWMVKDQLQKMEDHSKEKFFILPWILTQEKPGDLVMSSVKGMAEEANRLVWMRLLKGCMEKGGRYPNVLLMDYLKGENRDAVALCMAVNNMLGA